MLAGQVNTGDVLSITVTICVAVAIRPLLSIAVYVIEVVPTGKKLFEGTPVRVTDTVPDELLFAVVTPSMSSLIVTAQVFAFGSVLRVTSGGAVMLGGCGTIYVTAAERFAALSSAKAETILV